MQERYRVIIKGFFSQKKYLFVRESFLKDLKQNLVFWVLWQITFFLALITHQKTNYYMLIHFWKKVDLVIWFSNRLSAFFLASLSLLQLRFSKWSQKFWYYNEGMYVKRDCPFFVFFMTKLENKFHMIFEVKWKYTKESGSYLKIEFFPFH